MKLLLINGSPRGKGSNTKLLLDHFQQGLQRGDDEARWDHQLEYLVDTNKLSRQLRMWREAEAVVVAFPLYTDAMPALVKHFIEQLHPFVGAEGNPRLGFIVQSGFPETHHSRFVERYLEKLARRLGSEYLGTVIKGGVEGIQIKPLRMNKKLFASFYRLGVQFGRTGRLDKEVIAALARGEHLSGPIRFLLILGKRLGLVNFYWNSQLKKNQAYDKRFDRPYQQKGE